MKAVNLSGRKFGRLLVLSYTRSLSKKRYYLCKCDCGVEKELMGASLTRGDTQSCGCIHREWLKERGHPIKHGWSQHKLYGVWRMMLERCYNPRNKKYRDYGGRGIYVCERWHTVDLFCEDNINKWQDGLTLDRIEVNGPYSIENTRWVSQKIQGRNKRNNRHITLNGKLVTLAEFEERTGWKISTTARAVGSLEIIAV